MCILGTVSFQIHPMMRSDSIQCHRKVYCKRGGTPASTFFRNSAHYGGVASGMRGKGWFTLVQVVLEADE